MMNDFVWRIWKGHQIDKVVQIHKGTFVVRLLNEGSRTAILNMQQQHFDGKAFVVAPWSVNLQLGEEEIKQVSVCIQLPELH